MTSLAVEVAPGVHRVSVPLPFPPGEVAAWVIEGEDGAHTLVDTGIDTRPARDALRAAAAEVGVTRESLKYVVLTHAHPDHYGLAGPVRDWSGAAVALHEEEERLAASWTAGPKTARTPPRCSRGSASPRRSPAPSCAPAT